MCPGRNHPRGFEFEVTSRDAKVGSRPDDITKDPNGDAQLLQHARGPSTSPRVVALSRRRVGELVSLSAREPVGQQRRHRQKAISRLELRIAGRDEGRQLVKRVDRDELDARSLIDLLAWNAMAARGPVIKARS